MINRLKILIVLSATLLLIACNKEDIDQLPNEAILVSPANGAVVDLNTLAFVFNEGSDPEQGSIKHRVMISEDSLYWDKVNWEHRPVSCENLELKEGQKYFWKVQVFEYDEQGGLLKEDRLTESKVHCFHTNAINVSGLKAEASSHTNWDGYSFVELKWDEPKNTDYIEVTFEPLVQGIEQPILVQAGRERLLIKDFFGRSEDLDKEDAVVYNFAVRAFNTDGLAAARDTISAMPLSPNLVHDYDYNLYGVVIIGEQAWLDVNLMTTHYNDGTELSYYAGEDRADYGYYYPSKVFTSYTDKNPCPKGFHVPTEEDWQELELYIGVPEYEIDNFDYENRGNSRNIASRLKSKTGWNDYGGYSGNGYDWFGFDAKPAGTYYYDVDERKYKLGYVGERAYFWTVDENRFYKRGRNISVNRSGIYFGSYGKTYSIRCVSNATY